MRHKDNLIHPHTEFITDRIFWKL